MKFFLHIFIYSFRNKEYMILLLVIPNLFKKMHMVLLLMLPDQIEFRLLRLILFHNQRCLRQSLSLQRQKLQLPILYVVVLGINRLHQFALFLSLDHSQILHYLFHQLPCLFINLAQTLIVERVKNMLPFMITRLGSKMTSPC